MFRRIRSAFLNHTPVFYTFHFALLLASGILSQALAITKQFVWQPPEAFIAVGALLLGNTILKMVKAYKAKPRRSIWRELELGAYRQAGYSFVLLIAFHLGRHEATLFWLPSVTMGPLALFQFTVLLKDLIYLRWIDSEAARDLLDRLESKYPAMLDKIPKPDKPNHDTNTATATSDKQTQTLH